MSPTRGEQGMFAAMYEKAAEHPKIKEKIVKGFAYLKDIKDMRASSDAPPELRREGDVSAFRDMLVSPEQAEMLKALTEQFEVGQLYRSRNRVGSKKKKNIHPHDFIVDKTAEATNLYFVDPEISLLSKVRPNAVYLEAVRIYNDERLPEVALFRCRSDQLPDRQALKADALLQQARQLIDANGTPDFITEEFKNQVTMRIALRQQEATAQIRQDITVNNKSVNSMLDGNITSPTLDGIISSHQIRMQQFQRLLEANQDPASEQKPNKFRKLSTPPHE